MEGGILTKTINILIYIFRDPYEVDLLVVGRPNTPKIPRVASITIDFITGFSLFFQR